MTEPGITVALEGVAIGTLRLRDGQPEITYDADYCANRAATTLSFAMPKTATSYYGQIPHSWLWGLLPDNEDVLRRWAKDYDASISSPVSFLETEIGLDCAGAVQFYRSATDGPLDRDSGVLWIEDDQVEERLATLRRDATSWLGSKNEGQFSLAGAQSKTALRWNRVSQRWGVPRGDEPSTHIFKPAVPSFDGQHINEHLCLRAARNLGLVAAKTDIASFGVEEVLVVERFDRVEQSDATWHRVHQEDLVQALGLHPAAKYEKDGGPSAKVVAEAIALATGPTVAGREVSRFVDALIFNWIIGGTDAHAKNYGLLHSGAQTRLAPLYDVSSFLPYDDSKGHKIKLAMKIGGEYKLKRIGRTQWGRLAQDLQLEEQYVLDRCEELATAAPDAFSRAAAEYGDKGRSSSMPDQLTTAVARAASARLDSLATNHLVAYQAQAKYAVVLTDPVPFDDRPYSDTLSVRMQLLVQPPGDDRYYYYQFIVARWPRTSLERERSSGDTDFWDRVGLTAALAAGEWLQSDQADRTSNVIDAVVLRMAGSALVGEVPDSPTSPSRVMHEWTAPADFMMRPDRELKPMPVAADD